MPKTISQQVLLVGGGLAGWSAARRLAGCRGLRVTWLDPRADPQWLPGLPARLGARAHPAAADREVLARAARRWGHAHVRDEVIALDEARLTAVGRAAEYRADAILLACGCRPASCPFDGFASLHRLTDAAAAAALRRAFVEEDRRNWVVAGGGETGVQAATQLWRCAQEEGLDRKLFVVERGPALCATMGAAFADYIERQVSWLGIEVMRGTRIVGVDGGDVLLEGDRRVKQAGVVWCVGVEGQPFARALETPQTRDGRLSVNAFLQVERQERLFAAGDAAAVFDREGRPLRLSVQAAVRQGAQAADNLLAQLEGRPLRAYRHRDWGFLLPLGNGRGCGLVLGVPLYGRLPPVLHRLLLACAAGFRFRECGR